MQTQASKKHRDQQEPPPTCQAGPKPRDTVPREQWLQLQGKEAPSHLLLVLYFTFLVSLPCTDVNTNTHPFVWKPHCHEMSRRDAFPALGELWETTGFNSAVASQMLCSHLKLGNTHQKPLSNARGQRWRGLGAPGIGCWTAPLEMDSSPSQHTDLQRCSRIGSVWKAKTKYTSHLEGKQDLTQSSTLFFI